MDSCMPSTGAEEDNFKCLGKALAWRGHHNPQLLQFKLNSQISIHRETLLERANLLVFKNNCEWVFMDIFYETLKETQTERILFPQMHKWETEEGWGCDHLIFHVNNTDRWLSSHARLLLKKKEHLGPFGRRDIALLTQSSGCEFCAG